jgi:hypothetical protein
MRRTWVKCELHVVAERMKYERVVWCFDRYPFAYFSEAI